MMCKRAVCGYDKQHWGETLDKNAVIIDGECYHIGDENAHPCFRGFGGDKFVIKFNNGKTVTTTNLWHNGTIPKELNVKDNAKFVK